MKGLRNLLGLAIIAMVIICLYIFPDKTIVPKKIKSPAEMIADSVRQYLNDY